MATFEETRHVLVGYDGSEQSQDALRWAVEEARLRRLALTVCHAWHWPYPQRPTSAEAVETVRLMAEHTVERAVHQARAQAPGLVVRQRLVPGPPSAALLNEAAHAELIVVGSHGTGGFPGLAAGSAALQLPAYAHCPVIVHRVSAPAMKRVVVGVDGSPGAEAALAFGFEEAALRGWEVEAVYGCWELAAVAGTETALYTDVETLKRAGGARLERAVAPWREKYPQVRAWTALKMSEPRQTLLTAAAQAGLLVVGDRGEGGLPGLPLGAVSQTMLNQAPCPVAVAHPRT